MSDDRAERKNQLAKQLARRLYACQARKATFVELGQLAQGTPNELTPLHNRALSVLRLEMEADFDAITDIRQEWVDEKYGLDDDELPYLAVSSIGLGVEFQSSRTKALSGQNVRKKRTRLAPTPKKTPPCQTKTPKVKARV